MCTRRILARSHGHSKAPHGKVALPGLHPEKCDKLGLRKHDRARKHGHRHSAYPSVPSPCSLGILLLGLQGSTDLSRLPRLEGQRIDQENDQSQLGL